MHPEPFSLGFGDFMAFYGIPLQTRLTSYPSGFCYSQMQPVAPEEFPVRLARAAEVFETKGGRERGAVGGGAPHAGRLAGPPGDPGDRPRPTDRRRTGGPPAPLPRAPCP